MDRLVAMAVGMTLARPAALAALAAAAAPAVLAWWARRRGRKVPLPAVVAQTLALAAVALALAGPRAPLAGGTRLPYLLAVDASGSVRAQRPGEGGLRFPPGAAVERYYFAGGLSRSGRAAEASATRIGPVLRMIAARARAGLAAGVVCTDGRFTDADWPAAARAVAAAGAELLIVPMDSPPPDGRIASLRAVRRGRHDVEIAVSVSADASMARTLTVTRSGREGALLVRELALLGRGPVTIRLSDALPADAAGQYTARLTPADTFVENDSAAALVLPLDRKMAAVGAPPRMRGSLARAGAVEMLAPSDLPATPAALAAFAAVIVFDHTGQALTPAQRRALAGYVRDGGGLVMIGTGPHATPADDRDPLNRVLPLAANPFQRRPLDLAVLLDRSGSMAEDAPGPGGPRQMKFDLAAEAAVALREHLTERDALRVITFAAAARVEYDSGDAPADFAALRRALSEVAPAGSTKVDPAMAEALAGGARGGRTPMLLVLSDLRTEDFDPKQWAGKIRTAAAQLAVVAVGRADEDDGAAADLPLKKLAELLDAPYEQRDHLGGLAEVFARLVRRGRGESLNRAPTKIVATAALFNTPLKSLPQAEAYILSGLRGRSQSLARTAGGDHVLATRLAGLGRTASLAVPLTEGLNAAWSAPPAGGLVPAAAEWAARGANDPRLDVRLLRDGGRLRIEVIARQAGRAVNELPLTASVAAGDDLHTAALEQTAPGRYEGSAECRRDVPAAVTIRGEDGSALWNGSAPVHCPPEFQAFGADAESLRRLARLTGGRIVSPGELAGRLREVRRRGLTPLWPYLLAAALALMLAEWSLTRITRE